MISICFVMPNAEKEKPKAARTIRSASTCPCLTCLPFLAWFHGFAQVASIWHSEDGGVKPWESPSLAASTCLITSTSKSPVFVPRVGCCAVTWNYALSSTVQLLLPCVEVAKEPFVATCHLVFGFMCLWICVAFVFGDLLELSFIAWPSATGLRCTADLFVHQSDACFLALAHILWATVLVAHWTLANFLFRLAQLCCDVPS